jgi:hypothetical protein
MKELAAFAPLLILLLTHLVIIIFLEGKKGKRP